jgi:hypothetical protein
VLKYNKQNINFKSLPYSTFELLNLCPQHNPKGPYCTQTGQPVVKLATQQKTFSLYRPATGLVRVAENTNKLWKCFIKVAELLQMSQNMESILSLFCPFNVEPTLQSSACIHRLNISNCNSEKKGMFFKQIIQEYWFPIISIYQHYSELYTVIKWGIFML